MADDIRSRAGLDPREEAARRIRDGQARRAAAREALTQEQMRERTMKEMEARRGAVRQTANEMSAEQRQRLRSIELREMMEKRGREGGRLRAAERARERQVAEREAARQARMDREAAQRGVRQLNERLRMPNPITREEAIRFGAEPAERPANPRPNIPPRAAAAVGTIARGASRAVPGLNVLRELAPTSLEAGAEFERAGLAQAREEARMRDRSGMEQEMGEAGDRMPTPRPRPAARPAARRAEMSADRLNELAMGAEPANAEERVAQMRMRGRRQELEDRGSAFKKGGMVKKKAGGMIKPKAAPKKMMKGGVVAKPKSAAKPKAKPMPFKKGGKIAMKGRK